MDIKALLYFLAVANEESITRAAEVLNMTQPPLSRQMKELEAELGKQLFIRGSKKIILTEDGWLLKKRAQEIVNLMEKTKSELTSSEESVIGDVLVAAGEMEGISFLANIAKSLNDKYPRIHYRLYSGDAGLVKDKLDNGLVDFGLLIGRVDVEKYEYLKLPLSDRWGVIMRDDSEIAKYKYITAKMLGKKSLILSHQASVNSEMLAWIRSGTEDPHIVATYDLGYNASFLVKSGLGYMIGLDNIINTSKGTGLTFRPLSPPMSAEMCIVWKKNQMFGKSAKLFLEELKQSI